VARDACSCLLLTSIFYSDELKAQCTVTLTPELYTSRMVAGSRNEVGDAVKVYPNPNTGAFTFGGLLSPFRFAMFRCRYYIAWAQRSLTDSRFCEELSRPQLME
jgi:hypothetical protein